MSWNAKSSILVRSLAIVGKPGIWFFSFFALSVAGHLQVKPPQLKIPTPLFTILHMKQHSCQIDTGMPDLIVLLLLTRTNSDT